MTVEPRIKCDIFHLYARDLNMDRRTYKRIGSLYYVSTSELIAYQHLSTYTLNMDNIDFLYSDSSRTDYPLADFIGTSEFCKVNLELTRSFTKNQLLAASQVRLGRYDNVIESLPICNLEFLNW